MNWQAWAASIALHSGIVALLVGLAGTDLSLRQPERWEVKMAFTPPPEPPAVPAPPSLPTFAPVVAPQPPLQSPAPPPVAPKAPPAPTIATPRHRIPPVAAIKPPPKRDSPPSRQPPRPVPAKPASVSRKPASPPPTVAAKAMARLLQPPAASPFSDAPSRPPRQEFAAPPRSAFKETPEALPGHRTEASDSAARPLARDHAPPAKPAPESGAANWHASLRAKLRELRVYPPMARRLGQEGVVTLLLDIGADGGLRGLAVRQSSGHAVLDQAAQQLARNAVAALRG